LHPGKPHQHAGPSGGGPGWIIAASSSTAWSLASSSATPGHAQLSSSWNGCRASATAWVICWLGALIAREAEWPRPQDMFRRPVGFPRIGRLDFVYVQVELKILSNLPDEEFQGEVIARALEKVQPQLQLAAECEVRFGLAPFFELAR
jgi:hypothetical protein